MNIPASIPALSNKDFSHLDMVDEHTCLCGASGITRTLSLSELQTGHSNQCVKLKYLCTALITAWMGEDSALKDAVQLLPDTNVVNRPPPSLVPRRVRGVGTRLTTPREGYTATWPTPLQCHTSLSPHYYLITLHSNSFKVYLATLTDDDHSWGRA